MSPCDSRETLTFPLCASLSTHHHKVTPTSPVGRNPAVSPNKVKLSPDGCNWGWDPAEPVPTEWGRAFSASPRAAPDITLSKSSRVSSVSGSWENMQSSPLMQFPVVWYNLQGKSRSRLVKVNASSQNPPQSTGTPFPPSWFWSEVTNSGSCAVAGS